MNPSVSETPFGTLSDGRPITEFCLDNGAGMVLRVLDYGCIIRRWMLATPDAYKVDLVLGFDTGEEYERDTSYMGALVGRFANRIAGGQFELDGKTFQLGQNEGPHHLHGGEAGFHKQMWQASASVEDDRARLNLYRLSPAGEEGYPGSLLVMVTYELLAFGALRCLYQAVSDQATLFNISQHSYFNLAGTGKVLDHELYIDAENYLPVRDDLIPVGGVAPVAGGPFDFRQPRSIRDRLLVDDAQLKLAGGFDHNFVLDGIPGPQAVLAAPESGRRLEIYTDCPGLQFYSGQYMDRPHAGLCLEPQQFPDAPNHASFPMLICRPGEPCSMSTLYVVSQGGRRGPGD
ncbi:aldose epimerase family protein [Pseudoduganella violaceinigra]|uniref:aldose epimerase family protein n=1 Tax=Pseudoduganella violaceinigra TaxID=246602 RepID=UPI0003FAEF72|nr:aldose epimerase family protein [Pseudoduganella violaceinigra]